MITIGAKLLSSILSAERPKDVFIRLQLREEFFSDEERKIFKFIQKHVANYGDLPSEEVIKAKTNIELPKTTDAPEYFLEEVETRYKHTEIKKALLEANSALKHKQPDKAIETLIETATSLTMIDHRMSMKDFRADAADIVIQDHDLAADPNSPGIETSWPTLNSVMGKLRGGDVMVIAGRPGEGKTYLGLDIARDVWFRQKKRVLFVSMEMMVNRIFGRLASMQLNMNERNIRLGKLQQDEVTNLKNGLITLQDHPTPLWVVDGNLTATVQDIALFSRQVEPDVVIVDGAYLLEAPGNMKEWEKVKYSCQKIKQLISTNIDIPCILSYQFNRQSVVKKGKKSSASEARHNTGLEHLSGADAIGQIASIVLGLFHDDVEEEEGQQTYVDEKHIKILKGRGGELEIGGFDINWKFKEPKPMDFSEIQTTGRISYL